MARALSFAHLRRKIAARCAQARPDLRSCTYGAYYLIRDCVVTTGSFPGAWLWSLSPQANFMGVGVC